MITRFDHAVIAVRDIEAAIRSYAALGFGISAGGRHPLIGTRNALVRFGLDYIELLSVEDIDQARLSGSFGSELADFLESSQGLVGFVFSCSTLDSMATGLTEIGQDFQGPFDMSRERPDGRLLSWRLVIPGMSPWRKTWPFLIEWVTSDRERLNWDGIGSHENRCYGVQGIEHLVPDINMARNLYANGLGLSGSNLSASSIKYTVDGFSLHVREPEDEEERSELKSLGPGPYRLLLKSDDLSMFDLGGGSCPNGDFTDLDQKLTQGARIRVIKI